MAAMFVCVCVVRALPPSVGQTAHLFPASQVFTKKGETKVSAVSTIVRCCEAFLTCFFFSSLRCVAALFAAARYFCTSDPYLLCEVVVNLRGPRRCGVTCKNASLKREPTNGALFVKVSKVRGVPVLAGKLYDLWRGQRRIRFFSCRSGNVRSSCRR